MRMKMRKYIAIIAHNGAGITNILIAVFAAMGIFGMASVKSVFAAEWPLIIVTIILTLVEVLCG